MALLTFSVCSSQICPPPCILNHAELQWKMRIDHLVLQTKTQGHQ